MAEQKLLNLKVDGRDLQVPAGTSVIKACHDNGIDVPHYCYHENLSVAANCRICLVAIKGQPKLAVACGTPVAEGMEVTTRSKDVDDARKGVMEFLLINHPLDCPECDQAGECRLQNYSYTYGRDKGRFEEEKVVKSKATMGPHVKYWGSRCIVCTRCVRFTEEVSGTQELGVIYRGDRSEIAVFPGKQLDNPLSMNTVDVCPVGALVSADFLYQSRVWYLEAKESMCPDCSIGCNTRVDVDKKNVIKRIVPRKNDLVNKTWMCDEGRLSFPYVTKDRLQKPLVKGQGSTWSQAMTAAAETIRKGGRVAIGVSAWATSEAMEEAGRLAKATGARLFGYGAPARDDQVFPGFTISGDRNPNRSGLTKILSIADADASLAAMAAEGADTVVLVNNIPNAPVPPALQKVLDAAKAVVVLDFAESALTKAANVAVVLATLTHFESTGSYINGKGLSQSFSPVLDPTTAGRTAQEVLRDLSHALAPAHAKPADKALRA
ncbi:MAG: 2Fe-2S iron-sulfur cluster-binding protein [Deltaproteobacteria bacterium]|nr:2Fe-2S iron-sulfur cluster-binding protein [Deltaproteobacteria bacterium]